MVEECFYIGNCIIVDKGASCSVWRDQTKERVPNDGVPIEMQYVSADWAIDYP